MAPATSRAAAPTGVSPVLLTPFRADGAIDEHGFVRVVDHVMSSGVRSVMFPGFASEVLTLSDHERDRLSELLLDRAARHDVKAVVSVPDHATHHATRRALRLAEAGADVINVLPPYQLNPSAESVLEHVDRLLAAVAPVPVIVQYAPLQTGTTLSVTAISDLAASHSNLAAVKVESQPPGRTITALRAGTPSLPSLVGHAGVQLPDALERGAVGVQPGCSFVELYLDVWRQWEAGDRGAARWSHARILPYLSSWMQDVGLIVAAEKAIAMRRGLIDDDHCRSPARTMDEGERAMLDMFWEEFGSMLPVVRA